MARDILLIGSIPLSPAGKVFETVARRLGTSISRIPDGEQIGWSGAVRRYLQHHPDFASVRTALGLRVRERAYQAAILRAAHGARKDAQQLLAQRCPRPRTRNEHILATAARLPVSGLLRRMLERRSVRYRITA